MPIILGLIIIGIGAGFVATRLMKVEADLITTMAIGIAGAVIGGLVLGTLIRVLGFASGFVGAILGAMLLIWLWKIYFKK